MVATAVFWNVWGHRNPNGIHDYIAKNPADIFCLTEVTSMGRRYDPAPRVHSSTDRNEPPSSINGFEQLCATFGKRYQTSYMSPRYSLWRCTTTKNEYSDVGFGSALLRKSELNVVESGYKLIHLEEDHAHSRVLQYVVYWVDGISYLVAHLHGVWIASNTKGDDPRRNLQSQLVLEHLGMLAHRHGVSRIVFGGDLNLELNTNALKLLEQGLGSSMPFRNLVREFGIPGTRTPAYRKFETLGESRHADYVFVTPDVQVHTFAVDTSVLASDHAPLKITFE